MDIVFIGDLYPKDREIEIRSNSKFGIDNASNNFQWALLDGLDYYYPKIKVVTLPCLGAYPFKYKKIRFNDSRFSHKIGSIDYCIGYINIDLVKHLVKERKLITLLRQITNPDEETIIIIHGIHTPYLMAAVQLKKERVKVKLCVIATDLPQYMSESKNPVYLLLKKLDAVLIDKLIKEIDSFVLLSKHMTDYIDVSNKCWARMEGIYKPSGESICVDKEIKKTILYTGNIGERYGINKLIQGFRLIKEDGYQLWIRGNGNLKRLVLEASKEDHRITYFEEMSKQELLILQKKATILINPVPSTESFSKYFFPSKTMDYLASGTPTLMTRLACLPEEYNDHVFFIENENAEGIRDAILNVCGKNKNELDEFGKNAAKFINEKKHPIAQVKIIYELLNKLP